MQRSAATQRGIVGREREEGGERTDGTGARVVADEEHNLVIRQFVGIGGRYAVDAVKSIERSACVEDCGAWPVGLFLAWSVTARAATALS